MYQWFFLLPLFLGLPLSSQQASPRQVTRERRPPYHVVDECVTVVSEEGRYVHQAASGDGAVCGVYLLTDPDYSVQVLFDRMDVSCRDGGLVSFVDGWELNRQFFPNPSDHQKPLRRRYREFCGHQRLKEVFQSSQNAALVQYRIPPGGGGFSFLVRFLPINNPCNILLEGKSDVYTLRNYGRSVNCSLTALYPANVKILTLNVGLTDRTQQMNIETGTIHKCHKRGVSDYVEVGGADGLDTSQLQTADSICGRDTMPGSTEETILCGVSSVRLVSSGAFDNSVTVAVREAHEGDLDSASVICNF